MINTGTVYTTEEQSVGMAGRRHVTAVTHAKSLRTEKRLRPTETTS